MAFRNGYSTYIDRLGRDFDVRLQATVREVVEARDGVRVTYADADGTSHTEDGAGCIVTARGDVVPDLVPGLDAECK